MPISLRAVPKTLRSLPVVSLAVSVLVGLLVLTLRSTGSLESLELAAYDWSIRLLPKVTVASPRIVLLEITESDIRNQGSWPLPDAAAANILKVLIGYEALAIGFDIYRDIPVPPGHDELMSILTENPQIIAVMKFGAGGIPPPSVLKGTEQIGFNDVMVDPGGIVRRALLFMDDGKSVAQSLALRLALLFLREQGVVPRSDGSHPDWLRLGETTISPLESNDGGYVGADARGYQFLIDFREAPSSFRTFPLRSLLAGEIDPQSIKDKIVIIGVVAQDVKDFFFTPYSRSLQADEQVSGIALHAHVASQLIRIGLNESRLTRTTGELQETFWIIIWSLVGGSIGLWVRSPWRFSIMVSCSLFVLSLVVYAAFMIGWWVPLVPPAMGLFASTGIVTAYASNHERRQRAFLMQIFSRHVSKEVAESIWRQREKFLDGGRPRAQKLVVTTLFSDLKGFTPVAEGMDPMALVEWLNMYMETMAGLVAQHGGVVDDYFGDGIKANFGVPFPRLSEDEIKQDAVNAVDCALAMEAEMARINARWRDLGLPTVGLRVGILTGPAVAGALGSVQRLKYTTVGNTVNAASRLESYDKASFDLHSSENPCRILIGDATWRYVDDRFETEGIGRVKLKGLDQEIMVYRVVAKKCTDPVDNLQEEKP